MTVRILSLMASVMCVIKHPFDGSMQYLASPLSRNQHAGAVVQKLVDRDNNERHMVVKGLDKLEPAALAHHVGRLSHSKITFPFPCHPMPRPSVCGR